MGLFTFSKWYVVLMWSVSFLVYNLGFSKSNLFSKGIPSICALLSPRSGTRHTQSLAWCLAMNRPLVSLLNQTFNFTLYFLSLYCFPFHEFSLNSRNHYSLKKRQTKTYRSHSSCRSYLYTFHIVSRISFTYFLISLVFLSLLWHSFC